MLALVIALAVGTTAPLAAAEGPTKPDKPATVAQADEMICKTEQIAGTRLRKKVCRTRLEIEQRRLEDQQQLFLKQRKIGTSGP